MGRTACTEPQCLYNIAIPLLSQWAVRSPQSLSACTVWLFLYSPMGRTACRDPQCLYSIAIPLLLLWTVQPVQSFSACTVELYLYSTYRPYSLYKPQCLYNIAMSLLPSVPVQGCPLPYFTWKLYVVPAIYNPVSLWPETKQLLRLIHQLTCFCNRDRECLFGGTIWIFTYNSS